MHAISANDNEPIISIERLRSLLRYNPFTGHFYWRVSRGNSSAGSRAGKLHSKGYWVLNVDGREHKAHRLAWFYTYGRWPEGMVDHINLDKADNRIFINLREATAVQNQYNRTEQSNNTSGFKGVSLIKKTGRWKAEIKIEGKSKYLGVYPTAIEAASAYNKAAADFHGQFARPSTAA
jgi:hypothetical protein